MPVSPEYYRPTQFCMLIGDSAKLKKLDWKLKSDLVSLVKEILASELESINRFIKLGYVTFE